MSYSTNKNALVTGATSGLGKELSIQLARNGYHVLIHGKNRLKLDDLYDEINAFKGKSTIINLDLKDYVGIDKLGLEIYKKFNKLDLLVMNASMLGTLTPLSHQSPEEFEEILKTNLISNFRLLRSLEIIMMQSKQPKLVVLSSKLTKQPKAFWGAYSISKSALEQMVKSWYLENLKTNVRVYIIHPKPIRTNLRKLAMPGEDKNKIQSPVTAAKKLVNILYNQNHQKLSTYDL